MSPNGACGLPFEQNGDTRSMTCKSLINLDLSEIAWILSLRRPPRDTLEGERIFRTDAQIYLFNLKPTVWLDLQRDPFLGLVAGPKELQLKCPRSQLCRLSSLA